MAQLVIGVVCLAVGCAMVAARGRIVAREVRSRGRAEVPTTGWAVVGGLLALVGILLVVAAAVNGF